MLRMLFGFATPVTRRSYAVAGVMLMTLKYGVDVVAIHAVTGRWWTPWQLLTPLHDSLTGGIPLNPEWLFWVLAVWTLPFLWIGSSMTMRRASDAGWSSWLGLVFFVPLVNYLLMITLCLAPSASATEVAGSEARPIVDDQFPAALIGVATGVVFAGGMLGLQIYVLHGYGASLFYGTPVVMGAMCAYIQNRGHPRSWRATLGAASMAVVICAGAMLLFALEGAVCILLALPIALPTALFGAWMGRVIAVGRTAPTSHLALVLVALPLASGLERLPGRPPELEVVSSVEVNAPPEQVWPNVIGFRALAEPTELIFRTGIAYPTQARVDGAGVGAVRHCEFSTGEFVEPVTSWQPPTHLSFDVTSQPPPMEEWSPYRHIHPPHLDGYFRAVRGEFRLVPLSGNRTRLEGSTWYVLDIAPVGYWRLGAEAIVHAIHARVLRHIKALSEG